MGAGAVVKVGEVVGISLATKTLSGYYPIAHEGGGNMDKDKIYTIDECYIKHGLMTKGVWYEALNQAPAKSVNYIRKMRKNGEALNKSPRILLSTIHGVKGGEADNVVLLTDLSLNTQKGYDRNPDDENRLFYVGATRAKNHLHIIRPKDIYKSFKL